jgi:hypothetical protein
MFKVRNVVLALALLAGFAQGATDPMYIYIKEGQSVTNSNTTMSFVNNHSGGDSAAFTANEVFVSNTGSVTCYVDLDGTATTADFPLLAGQSATFVTGDIGMDSIGVITSASTTTINVRASKPKHP